VSHEAPGRVREAAAAAQGQLASTRIVPLQRWIDVLGIDSSDKANKIAARFSEALASLRELGVLDAAEVSSPRRGEYEVAITPGRSITDLVAARGIGSLDPVRTRTLVWHLGQLGFTAAEARSLLAKHGLEVQRILQRVHYERTVRHGLDSRGAPIQSWALWVGKGLRENWNWSEPDYLAWLETQERRLTSGPVAPAEPARELPVSVPEAPAAVVEAPATAEPPLPDNVWGEALAEISRTSPSRCSRSVVAAIMRRRPC
jgi:hypothetical protein